MCGASPVMASGRVAARCTTTTRSACSCRRHRRPRRSTSGFCAAQMSARTLPTGCGWQRVVGAAACALAAAIGPGIPATRSFARRRASCRTARLCHLRERAVAQASSLQTARSWTAAWPVADRRRASRDVRASRHRLRQVSPLSRLQIRVAPRLEGRHYIPLPISLMQHEGAAGRWFAASAARAASGLPACGHLA